MSKILLYLLSLLKFRIIPDFDGSKYLTRYYIYRKHFWWLPSIYIHCIHKSDDDRELHNHPFLRSLSFILKGSYQEEYRDGNEVKIRTLGRWGFNYIPNHKFHRLELLDGEVWTLFISGPKTNDWGFWDRDTGLYTPWRKYIESRGKNES